MYGHQDRRKSMNKAQAMHAKSIARHIREHAEHIVHSMASIESTSVSRLADIPLDVIEGKFSSEVPAGLRDIQKVLKDMLPELDKQR